MSVRDWNYDRLVSVQAMLHDLERDVMACLHRGYVTPNMQERMSQRLEHSREEIGKLKTGITE